MTGEPSAALETLILAFREHYMIARAGEDADIDTLEAAEEKLRDAFFTYDDELFTRFGVELPFDLLEDDFGDEDEDEDEEDMEDEDDFVDIDD